MLKINSDINHMDISKRSSATQKPGAGDAEIERLTDVDYAFILMRGIIITGGFFWLVLHPYPDILKSWLIGLFLIFTIYSFIIHALILVWPRKAETIYFIFLGLDLIFIGVFIKLTEGLNSTLFVLIYLLVALHSFYYGFLRGIALASVVSIVYFIALYDQWEILLWTDFLLRIAVIFLTAGFLGFIAEKERRDRDELTMTRSRLDSLQKELERSYKNLQDVNAQIQESEKLASIGRLAAELAHEINNPLDGIKNCLTVIKRDSVDAEKKKRYLELVDEAIYDIESSVRDLLDYAKRHEPKWEEVDIKGVLNRTLLIAEYKLQEKGIEVKTSFEDNLPRITGDSHQLQEVFFNIILNAIDAMPKGGRLTIEGGGSGNSVSIKVTDTGVGIPQKDLENIFQPFYTSKPLGEGTGLGLPVSLEIVKKHNGTIDVFSEVGVGTTFSITMPIARDFRDFYVR